MAAKSEIVPFDKRLGLIREEMTAKMKAVKSLLPPHVRPERFMRLVLTAVMNSPTQLAECSPDSIVKSMLRAAMLGLSIDDGRGLAYLVPFYNGKLKQKEAQIVVGYRGLALLARQSGSVGAINMYAVRKGDQFDYDLADNSCHHQKSPDPAFDESGKEIRPVVAAWARAQIIGQFGAQIVRDPQLVVLERWEIDRRRDGSAGYQASRQFGFPSPWVTNYAEMAAKTAVRDLGKLLPLSEDASKAMMLDDAHDRGEAQRFEEYDGEAAEHVAPAVRAAPSPSRLSDMAEASKRAREDADQIGWWKEKIDKAATMEILDKLRATIDPSLMSDDGARAVGEMCNARYDALRASEAKGEKKAEGAPSSDGGWPAKATAAANEQELNRVSAEMAKANLSPEENARGLEAIRVRRRELKARTVDSTELPDQPPRPDGE